MECLKLYDKEENGTMLLAELEHTLKALGERLSDDEAAELFADCMDPEDEDGNIFYAREYLEDDHKWSVKVTRPSIRNVKFR